MRMMIPVPIIKRIATAAASKKISTEKSNPLPLSLVVDRFVQTFDFLNRDSGLAGNSL